MIDRSALSHGFSKDRLPSFPCSKCNQGTLIPDGEVEAIHPEFSMAVQREDWSDIEMIELRISTRLKCSNPNCREVGFLYCHGQVEYSFDDPEGYETWFRIAAIKPTVSIISLPESLPPRIRKKLEEAFDAFWIGKGLSANCLRSAIEEMLTHFGVPDNKDGKWISLGNRLHQFALVKKEDAEFLRLLRPITNQGSHGDEVNLDTLLDVFEALEIYLQRAFSGQEERFEQLKQRIKDDNERAGFQ
ncbi:DUF4145 domain-containing protein [Loktanella sp. IMCC34160]|uniref:DUF4145 domain-containing protein n=1 Tax=Loktanella sp. IMCC34160 TaxID=2510646 RepID=UPI00101C38F0|nr:DUF4145 domain-containing protein [Loktanella sp. IMCC34160]RYG90736.1 DUF4145 domain-containing protein [Loktanella sp. IMCC34160]